MKKILSGIIFIIILKINLFAEIKAVWVPVWGLVDSVAINDVVDNAKRSGIKELIAEIRFRGDTFYIPNKKDSTYLNPERYNHILKDTLFDPFEYLIYKSHKNGIKVQAWVTTYLATPHDVSYIHKNHIYFRHPEWITYDYYKKVMKPNVLEGAYLDPGLSQVRAYLLNVFSDILINYHPDGFHLDYVRYPGYEYGYNPLSWKNFTSKTKTNDGEEWLKWRQNQITTFVKQLKKRIKKISPKTKLTAAVIWKYETAKDKYSQDWLTWIKKGYVDRVYLMAYTKSNEDFEAYMDTLSLQKQNKKIVVGLRAWDEKKIYKVSDIEYKIKVVRKHNFAGFSLFSSIGLKQNNYWKPLRKIIRK